MTNKIENNQDELRPRITESDRLRILSQKLNVSATTIVNILVNLGIEALERAEPILKEEIKKQANKLFKLK